MTPTPAVALNRAQFVALLNQSKFSRKNLSHVVPACVKAFASTVAEWHTEFRDSTAVFTCFNKSKSA
jgi:hypothetical protein